MDLEVVLSAPTELALELGGSLVGPKGDKGDQGDTGSDASINLQLASAPDAIIAGVITRDANEAALSAPVIWPGGTPGTYTATSVSTAFPGAVDAYTITFGSPVTLTYTQAAVTRDASGAVTTRPAVTVA